MEMPTSCTCCIAARQTITRTSTILCTCDPMSPRCLTISPALGIKSLFPCFGSSNKGSSISYYDKQNDTAMDVEMKINSKLLIDTDTNILFSNVSYENGNSSTKRNINDGLKNFRMRPIKRSRYANFPEAATRPSRLDTLPAEQTNESLSFS